MNAFDEDGEIVQRVERYYTGRFEEFGATPRGVDWTSAESQTLRFEQLLKVCERARGPFRLLDFGCGYGSLLEHVRARGIDCDYVGYDLSEPMLAHARERFGGDGRAAFVGPHEPLPGADYAVASGIFNVKQDVATEPWRAYVLHTIDRLGTLGARGFAFNALTSYSDPERMRPDLHYADGRELFDYCKRRHSRQVALLHDYGLWEFTIVVRK